MQSAGKKEPNMMGDTQQQLINISACEFNEFAAYMSKTFGEPQFKQGYLLIKSNRDILYADNGEQKLAEMLLPLGFDSFETVKKFINFSITYLIVQGIN